MIAVAMLLGLGSDFLGLDPILALFWSAVLNGVVAVPLMVLLMIMSNNRKIMGGFTLRPWLIIAGWLATCVMSAAAIGLFATWGK